MKLASTIRFLFGTQNVANDFAGIDGVNDAQDST